MENEFYRSFLEIAATGDEIEVGQPQDLSPEPNQTIPVSDPEPKPGLDLELMRSEINSLVQQNEQLKQLVLQMQGFLAAKPQDNKESKVPEVEPLPDFSGMSNHEVVTYVLGQIPKMLRPVMDEITEFKKSYENDKAQTKLDLVTQSINMTASKYPDFWHYKEVMRSIAQQYPNLGAEEVYFLAKGRAGRLSNPVIPQVTPPTVPQKAASEKPGAAPVVPGPVKTLSEAFDLAYEATMKSKEKGV